MQLSYSQFTRRIRPFLSHSLHFRVPLLEKSIMKVAPILKVAFLLIFIQSVCSEDVLDKKYCEDLVSEWAYRSLEKGSIEGDQTLRNLLFFLHVPRTGGRTYFQCIVRKLYANQRQCPRSYDGLRFNPRKQKCRLLATHDDYSIMSKLEEEKTSLVTILRNPVERVFSAYEFSVEVAARFLVYPNLTAASRQIRNSRKGVNTLDVWPWNYLVPWMRADLFSRRQARGLHGLRNLKSNDPYNMGEIVIPLHEFIQHPIIRDLIHNGETFQIAGLTNKSSFSEAHQIRHCIKLFPGLGEYALQVAKKRLDKMLFIGLTEHHKESASLLASLVGGQMISQLLASNKTTDSGIHSANVKMINEQIRNMSVDHLMNAYDDCIGSVRKSQSERRFNSLKRIAPANFSKKDRSRVSEVILDQMKSLNNLDVELYKYGIGLYAKQGIPKPINPQKNVEGFLSLTTVPMFISVTILVAIFIFVKSKRTLKIKI